MVLLPSQSLHRCAFPEWNQLNLSLISGLWPNNTSLIVNLSILYLMMPQQVMLKNHLYKIIKSLLLWLVFGEWILSFLASRCIFLQAAFLIGLTVIHLSNCLYYMPAFMAKSQFIAWSDYLCKNSSTCDTLDGWTLVIQH